MPIFRPREGREVESAPSCLRPPQINGATKVFARSAVAAVSDRRRRSEIDATVDVALNSLKFTSQGTDRRGEGPCGVQATV